MNVLHVQSNSRHAAALWDVQLLCILCARKARSTCTIRTCTNHCSRLSVCRPPPGGQLCIDRCWCGGLAERGAAGCGFIPEGESAAGPRQLQCHTSDLEPPGHKLCHQRGLPGMEMRDNRSSMRPRQRYMGHGCVLAGRNSVEFVRTLYHL